MKAIIFSNRTRKRIKVRKVIVHENFTTSGNDIALLQLGKKNLPSLTQVCPFPEDRVDLSVFSPVCLPSNGADFIGQNASVYGEEPWPFEMTRSYATLRAADLDWIVWPGYSLGRVHSREKPWKSNLEP